MNILILRHLHKVFLIFLTSCFLLLNQVALTYAYNGVYLEDAELQSLGFTNYESINPNLLSYPFKRISEEIKLKLFWDPKQKREYTYKLYEIRLRELVYVINNKKDGFIFFAADRYNSFIGKIKKEYSSDENLKTKSREHIKLLERLRDIYPANSKQWEKIQQTIDTTKSLI